jgi:CubicO group peptidase (beta-lactamase class C family)
MKGRWFPSVVGITLLLTGCVHTALPTPTERQQSPPPTRAATTATTTVTATREPPTTQASAPEMAVLPLGEKLLSELESYIVDAMERYDVPGAAVAIVHNDEIAYAKGFGVRELGGNEPVTPATLMLIGSSSKSMTTMMMATLVDDGIMDWNTPVVDILPSFALSDPQVTQQLTVRHLVCNCVGVPRRNDMLAFNQEELAAQGVIDWLAGAPLVSGLEEQFHYSNQLVAAGGYVATLAAGGDMSTVYEDYVELMEERILGPIGMAHSAFSLAEVEASGDFALPHTMSLLHGYVPIPLSSERWVRPVTPAGAVWSNVLDMGRYLITLLNEGVAPDGTRVVSAQNLAYTWEPRTSMNSTMSYGLGWVNEQYNGLRILQHDGGSAGFTSEMAFVPELDVGITVLSNQYLSPLNRALRVRLLELLLQQPPRDDPLIAGMEAMRRQWAAAAQRIDDAVDPEAATDLLGTYHNDALGTVQIVLDEAGTLWLDAGEFRIMLHPLKGEQRKYMCLQVPLLGKVITFSAIDDQVTHFSVTTDEEAYSFTKAD